MANATKKKLGLKGFAGFGLFTDIVNTAEEYSAAGEKLNFVGASRGNFNDNRESFSIPGDDEVYDSGSEWTYTDVEVTVQEAELATLGKITGSSIEEIKDAIEEGIFDIPEVVAPVYRALRRDGGYRCYRYYNGKLLNYSVDHSTRGSSSDGQPYTFTFRCMPRAIDGKIRGTADVANLREAEAWLESIPTVKPEGKE